MRQFLTYILLFISLMCDTPCRATTTGTEGLVFTRVNIAGGLANRQVQHVLQVQDGRMVITSYGFVDIYDGARFRHIATEDSLQTDLKDCNSPYTVYSDSHDRLWFKRWFKGRCLDLKSERYIHPLDTLFRHHGISGTVTDFFCDQHSGMWVLTGNDVVCLDKPSRRIHVERRWGNIQNLQTINGRLYLFFSTGEVRAYDERTLKHVLTANPLTGNDYNAFDQYCQVLQPGNGTMYVCRSGVGKGIVQCFDTHTGKWTEILRNAKPLHGGTVAEGRYVMVASPDCVYSIDSDNNSIKRLERFNLQGEWFPFRHFNWICSDRQGGTWLGSYNDGVFYAHPLREQTYNADGTSETAERKTVSPLHLLVTGVSIDGVRLDIGDRHLPEAEKYVKRYDLDYSENSITFEISALNYVLPSHTLYKYKLLRGGEEEQTAAWHEATPDNYLVDSNGLLILPLQNLQPGDYRLVVQATCGTGSDRMEIELHVRAPWWNSPAAHSAYVAMLILLTALTAWGSNLYAKQKMRRKHKEEMLLMQVRHLIERCNEYERMYADAQKDEQQAEQDTKEEEDSLSEADREFMHRAIRLVEENMGNGSYTVEQLSRDMCMERTGLYKKMTAMVEQTPSAFIRSIRLQKAMDMLRSGDYTVSEVAQRTGFSTASYFSKVFTAEYGITPSDCIGKTM